MFEIEEYNYNNVEKLFKELQPIMDLEQELIKPYGISTRILKDDRPFHPKRLWDTCHKYLDKRIYRSKGFFGLLAEIIFHLFGIKRVEELILNLLDFGGHQLWKTKTIVFQILN